MLVSPLVFNIKPGWQNLYDRAFFLVGPTYITVMVVVLGG